MYDMEIMIKMPFVIKMKGGTNQQAEMINST